VYLVAQIIIEMTDYTALSPNHMVEGPAMLYGTNKNVKMKILKPDVKKMDYYIILNVKKDSMLLDVVYVVLTVLKDLKILEFHVKNLFKKVLKVF